MREIKFRVWNKVEKFLDTAWSIDWEHELVCHRAHNQSNLNDCVLMQCTGLKDKNNREIYEGDLYQYTTNHDMYDPETGHTTFQTHHVNAVTFENGAFYHGIELLSDVLEYDDSLIYVGNIYENPELLEDGK